MGGSLVHWLVLGQQGESHVLRVDAGHDEGMVGFHGAAVTARLLASLHALDERLKLREHAGHEDVHQAEGAEDDKGHEEQDRHSRVVEGLQHDVGEVRRREQHDEAPQRRFELPRKGSASLTLS